MPDPRAQLSQLSAGIPQNAQQPMLSAGMPPPQQPMLGAGIPQNAQGGGIPPEILDMLMAKIKTSQGGGGAPMPYQSPEQLLGQGGGDPETVLRQLMQSGR